MDSVLWKFYGYTTPGGGKIVQEWLDALADEARDEIKDILGYLQNLPAHLWREPEFKKLDNDISEVRVSVKRLKQIYRIYGVFWPQGKRYSFTFLLGKEKKTKNDRQGIETAGERLRRLRNKEASIHEFKFNS